MVTESLEGINGVVSLNWSYAEDIVAVTYDPRRITPDALTEAATDGGRFRTELVAPGRREASVVNEDGAASPADFGLPHGGWSRAIILFEANWCGACKSLRVDIMETPEFARLVSSVEFATIDVDARVDLPKQYGVHAVPTIVIIDRHGTVLHRLVGDAIRVERIEEVLDECPR